MGAPQPEATRRSRQSDRDRSGSHASSSQLRSSARSDPSSHSVTEGEVIQGPPPPCRYRAGTDTADPYLSTHLAEIRAARNRIGPNVRRTPSVDTDLGVVKAECLQVTGSFKPRGAFNAALRLMEAGARPAGLAASSSGNHGRAVGWRRAHSVCRPWS